MAGSSSYVSLTISCSVIVLLTSVVSVYARPKDLEIQQSTHYCRENLLLSSDTVSLDLSAVNTVLESRKLEELAEQKRKEEALKQQVKVGSSYVTPNTFTGRFRLATHNDSDDIIVANINNDTKNSRIAGMGEYILECGKEWNIDPYVLTAIAKQESTYGKATPAGCPNNLFGRKAKGGGWQNFASLQEAFSNEAAYLASQYLDIGLTNLDSIGEKYCPGQGWPNAIRNRLREIRS